MGYISRLPNSNDPPHTRGNRWLDTNEFQDEFCLLVSGKAHRCAGCRRATGNRHLKDGKCPDCRPGDDPSPPRAPARGYNYGASSDSDFDAE